MTRVKELMSGLSQIPVVDDGATLFDAVLQVGVARAGGQGGSRSPAVLVVDEEKKITGFLEFAKLVLALAPDGGELAESAKRSGLSPDEIRLELKKFGLLEDALENPCKKAGETPIKSIMSIPGPDRITGSEVSISEAAFRMALSGHDFLFVLDGELLRGIISLDDVMGHICDTVRACRL